MNTKNMRKETTYGILLLAVYLILLIFPRGGFLMGLLLAAGVALLVIGLLPDATYQKVKQMKDNLLKKK